MAFIHGHADAGRYGCGERHDSVSVARCCDAGILTPDAQVLPCFWLIEHYYEGEPFIVECGAPSVETERGFQCVAGHSHVNMEFRRREGWDYAEDPQEARLLIRADVFPMRMDGKGPSEIARG